MNKTFFRNPISRLQSCLQPRAKFGLKAVKRENELKHIFFALKCENCFKGQPKFFKKILLCVCKIELRRFIWDLQSETPVLDGHTHLIIICFHVTLLTKMSMFSLSKFINTVSDNF